jgi:hypothetical protein
MNSKSYLKFLFICVSTLLIGVASINFFVDPGKIYPKLFSQKNITLKADEYINKLITSEYGLFFLEHKWNERDIKRSLVSSISNHKCIIIGSSRIMQVGSSRKYSSLQEDGCSSIMNLGVSGASLEDYLALSDIVLSNKKHPETIVLGVDPWSLNFNKDKRWIRYEDSYSNMLSRLSFNGQSDFSKNSLLINLFNFKYLIQSFYAIYDVSLNMSNAIPVPKFDTNAGAKYRVMLPDGSLVYSSKYISESDERIKGFSGKHDYKLSKDNPYQVDAVDLFVKLVEHLKSKGFDVVIMLIPYHEKIWSFKNQSSVKIMSIVEKKLNKIAKKLNVRLIGSYNVANVNCNSNDFFDAMHPKDICLKKITDK